jgi:Domain of unknown function (DUF6471)
VSGQRTLQNISSASASDMRNTCARASAFLKAKLKETEITYVELAKRLKKHGFKETEASVTMKLKRGTFAPTFFLACLAALELEGVSLEDI